MFFTRRYKYQSVISAHDIKNRLLGKHVQIHKLDFEVLEKDHVLNIIPHTEHITEIKTLPITRVSFKDKGSKIQVVINSRMRESDAGGPILIVAFCIVLLLAALLLFIFGKEDYAFLAYALVAAGGLIFVIFWMRMEAGYFDYIRKIRDHVREAGDVTN